MTERHLIAIDLDGTLLNGEKTIPEKTKKILVKAKQLGHKVVIATGRPYRASKMYYKELGLDTPIVNFNGAFVHHPLDYKWGVFHTPLELETAETIIKTCEAFQVKNIMVEVMDDVYLRHHDEFVIDLFDLGSPLLKTGDLHTLLTDDPTCLLIHPDDEHIDQIRTLLKRAHAEVIEQRMWGAPFNIIEIVRSGLSKAVGLERIANHYAIPQERIIAFGDEDNDLEMLQYAGHGIAMGNAIDELKDVASDVTSSNEDNGIARYLEKLLAL